MWGEGLEGVLGSIERIPVLPHSPKLCEFVVFAALRAHAFIWKAVERVATAGTNAKLVRTEDAPGAKSLKPECGR